MRMKWQQKLLAFVLAAVLLLTGQGAVALAAEETIEIPFVLTGAEKETLFRAVQIAAPHDGDQEDGTADYTFYRLTGNTQGYFLLAIHEKHWLPANGGAEFQDCVLGDYDLLAENGGRLWFYVPEEETLYDLTEAWEQGLFSMLILEDLFVWYSTQDPADCGSSLTLQKFSQVRQGDVNGDGALSVTDVVLLRKAILNGKPPVRQMELYQMDLNEDESLSVTDVVLLRKKILTGSQNTQTLAQQCTNRAKIMASTAIQAYSYRQVGSSGLQFLLRESCNPEDQTANGTASVWHYTAFLAMVSHMYGLTGEELYASLYPEAVAGMQFYKGTGDVTTYQNTAAKTMYGVNRANKANIADISGVNAVYDDQMWIIREFLYAYQLTGDDSLLAEAEDLTQVCLEGWDTTLREDGTEYGGIPWGPGYQTKHTCSNAPLVVALVELYEIKAAAGDLEAAETYLAWAKKIYAFVKENLQNDNGTYGDLLGSDRQLVGEGAEAHYETTYQSTDANENDFDHTAWTYNTGAMISGGAALYRVTGDRSYLTDAKIAANGAYTVLADNSLVAGCSQYALNETTVWFQLILLEGYLELVPFDAACETYIDGIANTFCYAYEHYNKNGFLPRNALGGWDTSNSKDTAKDVMDQAAAAQIFAVLAGYYGNK